MQTKNQLKQRHQREAKSSFMENADMEPPLKRP